MVYKSVGDSIDNFTNSKDGTSTSCYLDKIILKHDTFSTGLDLSQG